MKIEERAGQGQASQSRLPCGIPYMNTRGINGGLKGPFHGHEKTIIAPIIKTG